MSASMNGMPVVPLLSGVAAVKEIEEGYVLRIYVGTVSC